RRAAEHGSALQEREGERHVCRAEPTLGLRAQRGRHRDLVEEQPSMARLYRSAKVNDTSL
ncbi:hypothetical protein, partial [Stenotrophomonas sp. 232]|uniref:hypothetical protein n=1 Tax=Stenotrophomonas sp. 232 TaxID=2785387 RepID=UPI001E38A229